MTPRYLTERVILLQLIITRYYTITYRTNIYNDILRNTSLIRGCANLHIDRSKFLFFLNYGTWNLLRIKFVSDGYNKIKILLPFSEKPFGFNLPMSFFY